MSTLAERLIKEAESWLGTPFSHQGNIKGVAVDCAHFVAAVARDAGVGEIDIPHNYQPQEDGRVMMRLLSDYMEFVPTEDMQLGDVLALCDEALREPDVPRHLVFVQEITPITTFIIHASERGVVRHRINLTWRTRIHSCWRLRI